MRASIITPVLNGARHIEACVRGVASQGEPVLEHLIVDGASTDGTLALLRELLPAHPHVRLLPGPDRGQSDAMNRATAVARGAVIGILNVDDCYTPGAVRRGVAALARLPRPGMVVGDCRIVHEDGSSVWNRPRDLRIEALLHDSYLAPLPANPSAYFYHRDVHDIVGGYEVDDHFAMDAAFVLRCAERVPMRYVAEHWGDFHLFPGTKTFEDASGPQRVARIIDAHRARLTRAQRRKMERIRFGLRVRHFLRRVLHTGS